MAVLIFKGRAQDVFLKIQALARLHGNKSIGEIIKK
jgi:hypothetical protein